MCFKERLCGIRRPYLTAFLLVLGGLFLLDFFLVGPSDGLIHNPLLLYQSVMIPSGKTPEEEPTITIFNTTNLLGPNTTIQTNITNPTITAIESSLNTSSSPSTSPSSSPSLITRTSSEPTSSSQTVKLNSIPSTESMNIESNLVETNNFNIVEHDEASSSGKVEVVREGFAVWSESCQIPDLNPWHPTIRHLLRKSDPINCSSTYPAISETRVVTNLVSGRLETRLRIIPEGLDLALKGNGSHLNSDCCYRRTTRLNDNHIKYSDECYPLDRTGATDVQLSGEEEEFVRVQCGNWKGKGVSLTNFHASVPEKPAVEERLRQLGKVPPGYSLLVVGVDATSRLNGHRQLIQTMKYLRTKMVAVEMMGFQKVGDNTFPNLVPLLVGVDEAQLQNNCWSNLKLSLDNCTWLWRSFSSSGYRTFYAEDTAWMSTFNYMKPGFDKPPTDYYGRTYLNTFEREMGRDKSNNCYRCLGSASQVETVLDWAQLFVRKFSKDPYFALCWLNSLSHDDVNTASAGDLLFRDFFRTLYEGGHLKRTLVVLMGDHGIRWGSLVETYVGRMEERLPLLLISMPKVLQEEHPDWVQNIRFNAHRLVTPFDLHSTFEQLLNKNMSQERTTDSPPIKTTTSPSIHPGISLFTPVPLNRSCDDAGVPGQWCTCQRSEPISIDNHEVIHVVIHVLEIINGNLSATPQCSPLTLDTILSARLRSPLAHLRSHSKSNSSDVFDYSVTFRTKPGLAVFDATVRFVPHKHTHEMLGELSRYNLYGDQSWCVDDAKLRKICYCTRKRPV